MAQTGRSSSEVNHAITYPQHRSPLIGVAVVGGAGYYFSQTTGGDKAKARAKELEAESKQGLEKYKLDAKGKYYDAKVSMIRPISRSAHS